MIKKYPENDPYDGQTVSIPMITFQQFMETRQLCREMYEELGWCNDCPISDYEEYRDRMISLGILYDEQRD